MLLYDKKDESIDVYSIDAKIEELKQFKKKILQSSKDEPLFYYLRTNSLSTIKQFNRASSLPLIDVDYEERSILDTAVWSEIEEMGKYLYYDLYSRLRNYSKQVQEKKFREAKVRLEESQQEILDKYIEGLLDDTSIKTIYRRPNQDVFHFLTPNQSRLIDNCQVWEVKNMLSLPQELYLLHLLKNGQFSKLTDEDIEEQLKLFEINFLRTIKLSDIDEMINSGLFADTLGDITQKAETGSKILRKVMK